MNEHPRAYRGIGAWAALAVFILSLIYIVTGVLWLVSPGDWSKR